MTPRLLPTKFARGKAVACGRPAAATTIASFLDAGAMPYIPDGGRIPDNHLSALRRKLANVATKPRGIAIFVNLVAPFRERNQ